MISVLLVGKGNVATHLRNTFLSVDNIVFTQINSRDLTNIPKADITIIAVTDDANERIK